MSRVTAFSGSRRLGRVVAVVCGMLMVAGLAVTAAADAKRVVSPKPVTSFATPVALPDSTGMGEPSISIDGAGRIFVTAPKAIVNPSFLASPIWTSTDKGASFGAPVVPTGNPLSGGDTDLAIDSHDNVYQADLWLGNSAMAVSTDHGQSFVANEYGHTQPGDDRPWLAYSPHDNSLYMVYDGIDALHVAKSAPLDTPQAGLVLAQDVPAVPECAAGGNNPCSQAGVRQCVCPPGGIAADPAGRIYITYGRQNNGGSSGGVGVSRSVDGGLTWTHFSIPNTGSSGDAFDTQWNFEPVAVDSTGNVYVAWVEKRAGTFVTRYAHSQDHGLTWSPPVTVSTSATSVFPALSVASPGHVAVAWYGASTAGDPNDVTGPWSVYVAQSTNGLASSPSFASVKAAANVHTGCIQAGGTASCPDRSLVDFFDIEYGNGSINVIYTAGNDASGTNLYFTKATAAT